MLILADDLGWADVGYQGSIFYQTPHIDAMAGRGLVFSSAYSAAAVCSPSRAAILSGQSPARLQLTRAIDSSQVLGSPGPVADGPKTSPVWAPITRTGLPNGTPTAASLLGEQGYQTALIGKWHLSGHPSEYGFDLTRGASSSGATGSYFSPFGLGDIDDGPKGEYLTDRLTDEAVAFIERCASGPFFLMLSHYAPHSPFEAKEEWVEFYTKRVDPAGLQRNPTYAAMIHSLDQSVGRIHETLARLEILDNTITVFTSDNGGWLERRAAPGRRAYHVTSNSPLRSGKGRLYEGGVRVPMIMTGPGIRQGSTSEPVIGTDLFPTFAHLAGIEGTFEIDGLNLAALMKSPCGLNRDALSFHFPHQSFASSIRVGNHKLIHFYIRDRDELYNLEDDVGESRDLAAEHPQLAAKLRERLELSLNQAGADRPTSNPDFAH